MLETQTKQREDMAEEIRANVDAARSQMADISSRARACIEEIEDTLRAAIQPAPATEAAERRILTSGHIADPSALDEELALRALLSDD